VFWGRQQSFETPASTVTDTPRIHWLGPAKIHGLDHPTSNGTRERFRAFAREMEDHADSIVISCLGEIDVRVNIARLVLEHRSFACIASLAELYLRKLDELPNQCIVIWGPPPAANYDDPSWLHDYPVYGSPLTRNAITHLFNLALLQRINHYPRIRFITLFYDLVAPDLTTLPGALHDFNHLSIQHFDHARDLLATALRAGTKAALNAGQLSAIAEIHFDLQTPQQDTLPYVSNMQFKGPLEFQYFSNLRFASESYAQTELILRPGPSSSIGSTPVQLGNFAFMELFFQGSTEVEFAEFARFRSTFEGSDTDLFDARDPSLVCLKEQMRHHEKVMRRRRASVLGER
jgi:hypothetical protein